MVPNAIFFLQHLTSARVPTVGFEREIGYFFLKVRKEETLPDTFATENSIDFTK